jgi:hypothetical protein
MKTSGEQGTAPLTLNLGAGWIITPRLNYPRHPLNIFVLKLSHAIVISHTFHPRFPFAVHVKMLVEKMPLEQVYLNVLRLSSAKSFPDLADVLTTQLIQT